MESISLQELLSMEDLEKLAGKPFRTQIFDLLTGKVGPLSADESLAFDPDVVAAAYICWRAFQSRDKSGMLSSRPTYEIWTLMSTRLQLALRRAKGLHSLSVELYKPLGLGYDTLTREERVWIRLTCGDVSGARITRLRSKEAQSEILTAAQLTNGWRWDLIKMLSDEFISSSEEM